MSNYMKAMKPKVGGNGTVKVKQGYYYCVNPIKYIGDNKTIIYRSSLELKFCSHCDTDPSIIRWQSEPDFLSIRYVNPFKRRLATYYPDFYIQFKTSQGDVKHLVIELKADAMINPPKDGKMSNYVKHQFVLNHAKKKAAEVVCAQKGWMYIMITEKSEFFRKR